MNLSTAASWSLRTPARFVWVTTMAVAACMATLPLNAAVITESMTSSPSVSIPDGSIVGIVDTVSFPATIASITSVSIDLEVAGGFTGDLYAYLQHDTGLAVLLNRTGRTGLSGIGSLGYLDSGFDITLQDSAINGDVHTYQSTLNPGGGTLTGLWQPDGRAVSPLTVDGSEARDATLAVFQGLASGGEWSLFVADLSGGGISQLAGWTLNVTGTAVPEPETVVGVSALGLLVLAALRGRKHRPVDQP